MMLGKNKAIGYITTKPLNFSDIPQKVQALVIRDYAKNKQLELSLSHTELLIESSTDSLKSLMSREPSHIIFYSALIILDIDLSFLREIIGKTVLHFSLEDVVINTASDLDEFLMSIRLEKQGPDQTSIGGVRFMNLEVSSRERVEILRKIDEIMVSGQIINSSKVEEFEEEFKNSLQTSFAVGCGSGTDSLVMALKAAEIAEGDEVVLPAVSWISTAHAISFIGAQPVFCDVNSNLSMTLESVKELVTLKTKAIVCVHFLGKICDEIVEIKRYCEDKGLILIEDASQAYGATLNGRKAGTFGDLGCFSLNPMKPLSALGEAGAVVTNDSRLFDSLKKIRYCGMVDKRISQFSSLNFRLDAIQAAILSLKLKRFNERRMKLAKLFSTYEELFGGKIEMLHKSSDEEFAYYGMTIFSKDRMRLTGILGELGIETKVQHEPLMCEQLMYIDCKSRSENAKRRIQEVLSLPLHDKMTVKDAKYIAMKVLEIEKLHEA